MKKRKGLIILPLVGLLLCSCENVEQPTSSEESSELSSIEESQQDEPSDSSESTSTEPSEPEESGESSSSEKEKITTYELVINNKEELASITSSADNPNTNVYTLDIDLYTYIDGVVNSSVKAEASELTITSSNDNAIAVNGLTLILGSESDASLTLTATWNEHDVSDTVNINYTYTPHEEVISYRYQLTITNKEALTATWKIDDSGTRTVAVSLAKYTIIDGIEQSDPDIDTSGNNVTLTQEGEGEVIITGLDIAPSKVGSLTLSATYQNGEYTASDSVELIIEDSIYEYNYTLTINDKDSIQTTEEDPWVYQTGSKTVSITLSYYTYTASSGESEESTLAGTTQNVSISVYNDQNEAADNDITYSNSIYGISLSLSAVNSTYYTVVFTWTSHTEASDSLTFYVSEPVEGTTTYSISITNREELTASWYLGDNDRTLEYSVKATTGEETSDVALADYINGLSVSTSPEGYVNAALDTSSGAITLSLIDVPEDNTTVTVYLKWEQYGITEYVELNLGVHTYKIEITNSASLMADWTIEDEATRTIEYSCYIDDTLQELLGLGHVSISSSDEEVVSVEGTTLRAVGEGSPTLTATWYSSEEEIEENILDTDSVVLSINDNIKATAIKINTLDSNTIPYMEEVEISASVTGKDGRAATDPEVIWESSNETGISVAVDSSDSTKATVTGLVYSAQATITATCGEFSDSISLDVAAKEEVPVKVHSEVLTPYTISSPDDRGVYVLGIENGDTYLAYDNAFTTTTSYDEAAAIRVVAAENGYYLELGDKYIANSTGSLILKEETYLVNIDQNGAITDGDYTLGLSDNTLSWVNGETSEISLLDVKYTDQAATYTASQLKDEDLYFACEDSDGYFHYYTGSVSGGHGSLSSDITEAVKMSIEDLDNNQFYLKDSNGKYLYIYIDGTGGCKSDVNANPVYYDSEPDTWRGIIDDKDEDGNVTGQQIISRFFAYYTGGDMRTYDGNYAPFRLYFATEVPQVKGITIHVDENDLASKVGHTFTPTVSQYPEVLDGIHSVSSADLDYTTEGEGSISVSDGEIAFASAGKAKITGTYKSVSDSFDVEISEGDGTKELTYTHDVTNNTSSKSGDIASTDGGTFEADGLTWTYTSLTYKSSDSNKGLQVGSGTYPQNTNPFTLSTDFGTTVKLSSITINISVASGGGGVYSINFGETAVANEVEFTNTSAEDKIHTYSSGEEPEGQSLSISLLDKNGKAMYIKTISFTIIVDENYQLPLYAEA